MAILSADPNVDTIPEQTGEIRITGADALRQYQAEGKNLLQQARSLRDAADRDKRELHADEQAQFDRLCSRADDIDIAIERYEARSKLDALSDRFERQGTRRTSPTTSSEPVDPKVRLEGERSRVLDTYIRHGERGLVGPDDSRTYQGMRALAANLGGSGGFLQTPEVFTQQLVKNVDDMTFVWGLATTVGVEFGQSLGCPSLENDPADSDWTSEISLGTEDTTLSFGKRRLHPNPLSKYILVSNDLLQISTYDVGAFINQRLAYKNAVTLEKSLLSITAVGGRPLPVFVASNDGIPSSRDFTGDNTATVLKMDSLKEAVWGLKEGYLNDPSTAWCFGRAGMLALHKIKDGDGRYLLTPDLSGKQGMQMLGFPVKVSEFAPSTFTTGLYVGCIGAWSTIWGAYVNAVAFQRFNELRGLQNQTIFATRTHIDAMPSVGEAFSRIKMG